MLHRLLFVWRTKILLSLYISLFLWISLREITEIRVNWGLISIDTSFLGGACLFYELIYYLHGLHSIFEIGIHETFSLHWANTIRMILFLRITIP